MGNALASAYAAAPVWLQNVMLSAYGMRLRFLRYGRQQRRYLEELGQTQWLSSEKLRALQLERLTALVHHAYETVPLYQARALPRRLFTELEQLQELPLLAKDELRAPRDVVTSSLWRGRRLSEVHTGGTTGKPLTIFCDRATLQRNYAFFARFREWAGMEAGGGGGQSARVATFAGRTIVSPSQTRPPFWRFNAAAKTMLFSSYHIAPDTLPAYVDRLRSFSPDLIDSYPSSLAPIARYVLEQGINDLRPRAIITSSETLDAGVRRTIEAAFGCRVFDHYGAAEMAALVTQCDRGSYHVNPEFGIVEILTSGRPARPGELGEIVATGFVNPVMPLIRYATGDLAIASPDGCACGRAFPVLERIEGRTDDVLVTPDGRWIGRLDPIFKGVSSLYETRIVQDRTDHVRIELVPLESFTLHDQETLVHELRQRLGPAMQIDVVRVTRIPRTAAGKFPAVVNLARP
jgi:phenylacetate-CoA ligase